MTKVSDYLNEKRNNPEKQEDRLAAVIIGVIAVVVIVLLLLILWEHAAGERADKELQSAAELTAATYEEHMAEYMAQNSGQESLAQEYLTSVEYLYDKVEELLTAMTQVEQNVSETMEQYQEGDTVLREEITSLHTEVTTIMQNLKKTQTKLQDLTDIVLVMNEETIPEIQAQIEDVRADMDNVRTNIADLYAKIAALQQEDAKLWASITKSEKALGDLNTKFEDMFATITQVEQNLAETVAQNQARDDALQEELSSQYVEIHGDINNVQTEITNLYAKYTTLEQENVKLLESITNLEKVLEEKVGKLTGQILQYRYNEGENTLYLEPYKE